MPFFPLRRNDTFTNAQFSMKVRILDFLPGNRLKIEYTRKGHVMVFDVEAAVWLKSLTNENLFTKNQNLL